MCHVGDIVCYYCDTQIVRDTLIQRCEAYALKCFGTNELKQQDIQVEWDDFARFIPRDIDIPSFTHKECPFKRTADFKVFDYPCPNIDCKRSPKKRSDDKIPNSFIRNCDSVTHFYAPKLVPIIEWFNKYIENCIKGTNSHRKLIAPFEANEAPARLETIGAPMDNEPSVDELVNNSKEQAVQSLDQTPPGMNIHGAIPANQINTDAHDHNETNSLFSDDEVNVNLAVQSPTQVDDSNLTDQNAQSIQMGIDPKMSTGAYNTAGLDQELEDAFNDFLEMDDSNFILDHAVENIPQEHNSAENTPLDASSINPQDQGQNQADIEA
ncbi:hypothetical protein ACHAQA_001491 [Verticillium albo-atrum]